MLCHNLISSPPSSLYYLGDRFRIEHVIVNFLSNAVKFSPIGSQIVIQMTESDTRSGVPLARDRNAADREARGLKRSDSKDKKKSIWSRVRMSQSPERSPKSTCRSMSVFWNFETNLNAFAFLCLVMHGISVDSASLRVPIYFTDVF